MAVRTKLNNNVLTCAHLTEIILSRAKNVARNVLINHKHAVLVRAHQRRVKNEIHAVSFPGQRVRLTIPLGETGEMNTKFIPRHNTRGIALRSGIRLGVFCG